MSQYQRDNTHQPQLNLPILGRREGHGKRAQSDPTYDDSQPDSAAAARRHDDRSSLVAAACSPLLREGAPTSAENWQAEHGLPELQALAKELIMLALGSGQRER